MNIHTMTDDERKQAFDRLASEIETGRDVVDNTAITLIIILVLAGVGFWIGG